MSRNVNTPQSDPIHQVAFEADTSPSSPSFQEAFWQWLKVGFLSFGGPAGQIALMHKLYVEEKRWIGEQRFLHALNYCMLLPGPEAQQLAIYIGWMTHRLWGGITAGLLFVLPGAVMIMGLSALYAQYHQFPLISALFFGIKAAVVALIIEAALRIGRRVLHTGFALTMSLVAFAALFFFEVPFPLIILLAAGAGFIANWIGIDQKLSNLKITGDQNDGKHNRDSTIGGSSASIRSLIRRGVLVMVVSGILWLAPILALGLMLGSDHLYVQQGIFFSKMAMVTFGGAYAVLSYVAQQAVENYQWLSAGQMLDGLGLAETTPGPLILVLEFVGFMGAYHNLPGLDPLLAGLLGALITLWVTFVPCFLWILAGAPFVERLHGYSRLNAAVSAITAAVVGVIANLAVWFALHVMFNQVTEQHHFGMRLLVPDFSSFNHVALILTAGSLFLTLRLKWPVIPVFVLAALIGAFAQHWLDAV